MKVGDLVRSRRNPRILSAKMYPWIEEIGIIVGWQDSHPIVLYPSARLAQAKSRVEVISEGR